MIMENKNQKIGISQKAIVFNEAGKIFAARRSVTAPSRPLHWDLPGGELDFGEDTKDGILREIKEETGLEVRDLEIMDALSEFNDIGEFWVTICYKAKAITINPVLSYEHDDFKWITPDEFQNLEASLKNKKFVEKFKLSGN